MTYYEQLRALLTPAERNVLKKLSTGPKVQDFLDSLPINFAPAGESNMSPRRTLEAGSAHCLEGALLAAAAFAYHGSPPLLLDLRATHDEDDHVVALFRVNSRWGAVSKTNHSVLRYRDPIYMSPRELAASYFHEYTAEDGRKVLREYSRPFDLRRYKPEKWLTESEELDWLSDAIDRSPHSPLSPIKNLRVLRKASQIELDATDLVEWKKPKKKRR